MTREQDILRRFLLGQDRLVLQASDLSLGTLASMVSASAIELNPKYQRRERWSAEKQSALIESFLLNIPVPPVYLEESRAGKYAVVDGQQRISAIHRFMTNELPLTSLESFDELEGLRFGQLPEDLRNALTIRPYVRVVTLLKQSDKDLKYEVFTRLNRGGERMEDQELRNVMFRGSLNDSIYSLSELRFLRQQLKISSKTSIPYRHMVDAEMVLRFMTLRHVWSNFSGSIAKEMDSFMEKHQHSSGSHLREFESSFKTALARCEAMWGTHAFHRPAGGGWRDQFLSGMYDAEMIASSLLTDSQARWLADHTSEVVLSTRGLFADPLFELSVRTGTNTPSRVKYRIEALLRSLVALIS